MKIGMGIVGLRAAAVLLIAHYDRRHLDNAAPVRAGVMPPQRSLQQTRTVKGGQMAAAGTIGAGVIGAIQETVGQAHDALAGVVPYLDAAKWGLLAVTLIGIGVVLWARIDDRRKGLR
jgi:hypothetical protein